MAEYLESPYPSPSAHHSVEEGLAAADTQVATWWIEGEPVLLERAVVEYRAALEHCSADGSDQRIRAQIGLSDSLRLQFEEGLGGKDGDEELFLEALYLSEQAVEGTAPRSILHLQALRALGQVLFRFFHTKEHIQRATDTFRGLVDILSDSQPGLLITVLPLYSLSLLAQFSNGSRDPGLLKLANATIDRAFTFLSEGENVPYTLIEAQSLARAQHGSSQNDMRAINEAIRVMQGLVDSIVPGHPRLHYYWNTLGLAYYHRYRVSGSAPDLDCLIMAFDHARKQSPPSHPLLLAHEGSYAAVLYYRFDTRGDVHDQQEAIEVGRACVRRYLSAPPGRSHVGDLWVNNLVGHLTDAYSQTGDLELLDEAISLHWDNFKRVPPSRHGTSLRYISQAYQSRFVAHGRLADLQNAYSTLVQALECPLSSTEHMETVQILADVALVMYNENKDLGHLHKAISLLQTSLSRDWIQPPQIYGQLESSLGLALVTRAGIESSLKDIEDGMQCQRRALQLLAQEDPHQILCYFRLGLAEFQSFVIGAQRKGIDNSIAAFNRALSIMPQNHVNRASYLLHLSKSLLALSDLDDSFIAFAEALERLQEAATCSTSWPADRYQASILCARAAYQGGQRSQALEAYRAAIALLPELTSVRLEDELRMRHVGKQARDIPQDAAACALELGEPGLAVELLEAGRTLLWNAQQELRADLARLRDIAPTLARELAQTNAALEFRPQNESKTTSIAEHETERRRLHRLAARRTDLICDIRKLPGFEQFLLPLSFASLRHAAAHGPVVVLNASVYRCDAIVIGPDDQLSVIPLDNIKHDQVKNIAKSLQYWLAEASRDPKGTKFLEVLLQSLLDWLWKTIGIPVRDALQDYLSAPGPRRVWWCPTGALSFLPIHACGPYDGLQLGIPDLVISSYTPTISALLRAQKGKSAFESASRSVLVVSQPDVPGHVRLPGAMDEMKILQELLADAGTFLVGASATVSTVETCLRDSGWFHVISHGSQDSLNPLESSVALYDGPLKLARLAQINLPHAEFAFLSACHSAKGTAWVPDESMHLAAGMIFAGFKGVVATAWGIADRDAPEVTRRFYTYLKQKSSPLRATDAAEALHIAVRALRKSGVSAARWVPFIHLGA